MKFKNSLYICSSKNDKYRDKMEKVKYQYDFPDQREIAKSLLMDDRVIIAERTGYSIRTVNSWCLGKRKSEKIKSFALLLSQINQDFHVLKTTSNPSI